MNSLLSLLDAKTRDAFRRDGHWRDETLYGVLSARAAEAPDRTAISDRCRSLSYADLARAVDDFAADLAAHGVRPGQRVALWMPDRIESAIALLACSRDGLVCCPSPHARHTVEEVAGLLERMRAAALVYQDGFGADAGTADLEAALSRLATLRRVLPLAPITPDSAPPAPFDGQLVAGTVAAPSDDPDRVMYLAFTSGSTGNPKGVMHSDNTLLVTARRITADWRFGPQSVVYSLSPFCHNLGIGAFLTSLVAGAGYVVHDRTRRESLVDRLVETRTRYLVGVPTHAIDLLEEMRGRGIANLGHEMAFRVSGAAVPAGVIDELLERGVTPQSGYGMTETNAHQYTLPDDDPQRMKTTSGRACAGYELRIWDEDDPDTEVPVGTVGQIGGRGASLMLGYFDDQMATEAAFNAHGWFMTGDLGALDEDGYLRITGRKKELIIRGGHNINPARIEELATAHAAVAHAAAVPLADDRLGERVCLALAWHAGAEASADQVLEHLASKLSRYDMPEFVVEIDEIPLMSNGKILKRDLMAWIRDGRVVPVPVGPAPVAE